MEKGRPGQNYIFSTQFVTVDELMGIFEEVTGRAQDSLHPDANSPEEIDWKT